jgi:uncharacterized membrane protein YeaQ/YmgE (transglycosylase-associated protein family)
MGVITWIVPGLGTGLLASMLTRGRRSQGLAGERRRCHDQLPL